MADGIHSVLIDPGVEGSVVHIPDYLSGSNLVVKVGGICASSKEDVARIHGFDDRKGLDKLSHARIRFLLLLPLTFPAGHDLVSQVLKTLKTFHGRGLDIGNTGHTHAKNNPRTRRLCCWFRRNHPPSIVDQGSGIRLGCERAGYVAIGLEAGLPPAADVLATRAIPERPGNDW